MLQDLMIREGAVANAAFLDTLYPAARPGGDSLPIRRDLLGAP